MQSSPMIQLRLSAGQARFFKQCLDDFVATIKPRAERQKTCAQAVAQLRASFGDVADSNLPDTAVGEFHVERPVVAAMLGTLAFMVSEYECARQDTQSAIMAASLFREIGSYHLAVWQAPAAQAEIH